MVERDYQIMGAIEKWGILGLGQLEGLVFKKEAGNDERTKLFFNEAGREIYTRACYKRLSDLEAGGYVRSQFYLNHRKLYTLTEGGHEALIVADQARLKGFRRSMSEALIDHEIKVNGVGLVLTEILGLRVAVERQLAEFNAGRALDRKGQEAWPDLWIMSAPNQSNPRAIEVELTQKSEQRYKEIFYRYSSIVGYGGLVLYLTGWPRGPETLCRLIRKWDQPFIYVTSLEQFRAERGRCRFSGCRMEDDFFPGQRPESLSGPAPAASPERELPAIAAA